MKIEFRVVRELNNLLAPVVRERNKYTYAVYECDNNDGVITVKSRVDEIVGYSRNDAWRQMLLIGMAANKPVIDIHGVVCEECLAPQKDGVMTLWQN